MSSDDFVIMEPDSALDLTIKGSVGTFAIRSAQPGASASIPVTYLETHIGFALDGDADERILQHLAPVREVFKVRELDFSQLMQRDVDDARVSLDLIPYLLEDRGEALVKLFPPIIVVVLPTDQEDRPAPRYPTVEEHTAVKDAKRPINWKVVRSGQVGSEAFEFRQMISNQTGEASYHDYAQLKINTTKCDLAIVDGQHRAMALLALYRNFKSWPQDFAHYADYYKRWSKSVIKKYDLSDVRLPILFCTFPTLHEGNQAHGVTTTEACRAVFLALNKNAKPVTTARNHLLDDRDLIAYFLRSMLEEVKAQDASSEMALRIWNFELDAEGNQRVLTSEMAVSGVMHLYGATEFLMLNKRPVERLTPPRQNLYLQKDLSDCVRRLDVKDQLGEERARQANRQLIDKDTASILTAAFKSKYGSLMIRAIDRFWAYRAHCETSLRLEAELDAEPQGKIYHSVLFEGQGVGRVFDNYVESIGQEVQEINELGKTVPPELSASYEYFQKRAGKRAELVEDFYVRRTRRYLSDAAPKGWAESLVPAVQELYRRNFLTEAFQYALLITFFLELERLDSQRVKSHELLVSDDERALWFDQYVDQLNSFFQPGDRRAIQRIFGVFVGELTGLSKSSPTVARSSKCLRRILIPGQLKPDEWTKFRYLLLELWNPTEAELLQLVTERRRELRLSAARLYQERELDAAARREGKLVSELKESERLKLVSGALKDFCSALKQLGVEVTPQDPLFQEPLPEGGAAEAEDEEEVDGMGQ